MDLMVDHMSELDEREQDEMEQTMITWAACRMNIIRVCDSIFTQDSSYPLMKLVNMSEILVQTSPTPLTTALAIAGDFARLSEYNPAEKAAWMEAKEQFTDTAHKLINDVESDHIAYLLLTQQNELGDSPIKVALATKNEEFIANPTFTKVRTPLLLVSPSAQTDTNSRRKWFCIFNPLAFVLTICIPQITNTVWSEPDFLKTTNGFRAKGNNRLSLIISKMITKPYLFFLTPQFKFILQGVGFILILTSFTMLAAYPIDVHEKIRNPNEVLFGIFAVSAAWEQLMMIR